MDKNTPANDEAGTIDTKNARTRVRIARMLGIAWLLAG
jgi:hypothetical protein